ncbi:Xaa-Pro aminopeptidase 3 isoform X2 [Biomphalaria pfeifferi]|uniref:Xaa-Pro aminopeptidase 3 isoform X2 n=1 Tax=Biomphalaria pfeifferi TaxID=112525 RepID=A0AAD8BSR6_BIOPF|nr:Xaa-Pro aminopeptidase 3 isoform X2 [Biomphalaria pfeifferi]
MVSGKAVIMKVISFRRLFLPFTSHVRYFGQPAAQTHPHLIAEGEVTPGISRKEIYTRRCKLVTTALDMFKGMKSAYCHLFIFPSATTQFMTNDIPYVFRQNSDFLYFKRFQEPDSLLLIEASGNKSSRGEHIANLFVPRKDPAKELWNGPRSGTEGAIALTGVDGAFNSNELEKYLHHYNKTHKDFVLWYNHAKPIHQEFHNQVLGQVLHDKRYKCVENTAALAHRLRVLKSQPEILLIQQSITIACESFIEVMKFSKPQHIEVVGHKRHSVPCCPIIFSEQFGSIVSSRVTLSPQDSVVPFPSILLASSPNLKLFHDLIVTTKFISKLGFSSFLDSRTT